MAKKATNNSRNSKNIKPLKRAAPARATSTPVRNSAVPKTKAAPVKREVTHQMIALRAYEIHLSGTGGSEFDNWVRAERELRGL